MSLLSLSKRHQDIIIQSSNLNYKLNLLNQKMMDLQSYASSIANSPLSIFDLMSAPASMFGKMSNFMQVSNHDASIYAQRNVDQAVKMNQADYQNFINTQAQQGQTAQADAAYKNMMYQKLYQNVIDTLTKKETDALNREEKKIEQQKAQIETQVKMLDSEEKTVSEAEGKEAEKTAPKFA